MSKVLLMPTAKLVAPELRAEFGPIPSAMIPLDSRPALQYIAEPYLKQGFDLLLAVDERADMVREYVERHPELGARIFGRRFQLLGCDFAVCLGWTRINPGLPGDQFCGHVRG